MMRVLSGERERERCMVRKEMRGFEMFARRCEGILYLRDFVILHDKGAYYIMVFRLGCFFDFHIHTLQLCNG